MFSFFLCRLFYTNTGLPTGVAEGAVHKLLCRNLFAWHLTMTWVLLGNWHYKSQTNGLWIPDLNSPAGETQKREKKKHFMYEYSWRKHPKWDIEKNEGNRHKISKNFQVRKHLKCLVFWNETRAKLKLYQSSTGSELIFNISSYTLRR